MKKLRKSDERKAELERAYHEGARILCWDIESTALNAAFGTVLCIGYKWLGDKTPKVISILDGKRKSMLDDRRVVETFAGVFNQCDYHVTWYGKRFDLPMIRSKLIEHGLPPIAPKPHVDLWEPARKLFKLHSNRLGVWQSFLGTPSEKTPLDFGVWKRAAHGDEAAIAYVVKHCKADVNVLEEMFIKLRPWVDNLPILSTFTGDEDGCPRCGSHKVMRMGVRITTSRTYQRYQCQSCGGWFQAVRSLGTAPYRPSPS